MQYFHKLYFDTLIIYLKESHPISPSKQPKMPRVKEEQEPASAEQLEGEAKKKVEWHINVWWLYLSLDDFMLL